MLIDIESDVMYEVKRLPYKKYPPSTGSIWRRELIMILLLYQTVL